MKHDLCRRHNCAITAGWCLAVRDLSANGTGVNIALGYPENLSIRYDRYRKERRSCSWEGKVVKCTHQEPLQQELPALTPVHGVLLMNILKCGDTSVVMLLLCHCPLQVWSSLVILPIVSPRTGFTDAAWVVNWQDSVEVLAMSSVLQAGHVLSCNTLSSEPWVYLTLCPHYTLHVTLQVHWSQGVGFSFC